MKKLLYILFFIIASIVKQSHAENSKIDSLLILLKIDKEDTNKVIHFNKASKEYILTGEYDKGLACGKQALLLAQKTGFKKGIANSYNNIGVIFKEQGNYAEALKNYFAALKMEEEINDKQGIASSYNNIGNIYKEQDNLKEALKKHFSALKIRQEIKDKKGIAGSYNNIGLTYIKLGNLPEALKNYFAALKINEAMGNKDWIARNYNNIGIVYYDQGNLPEALKMYLASLKIKEEIKDMRGIAAGYLNIGLVYIKQHKLKEAQTYLNKALQLSMEIGSKDDIKATCAVMTVLDSATGNYKAAFDHQKLFMVYRDSINNEETKKKSMQSSMQYEFDKKEIAAKAEQDKLDAITSEEKKKQQFVIYGVAAVLLIVLVFSALLYKRFRLTNKQKQIIELKNKETEEQKHLIEEKHKEITDSINYAERIQRSFMATKEILDENLDNYFVLFKPKDVVSGDFYWASKLNNGNFALVTADSTGHGVPGAIMSLLNITSLEKAIEDCVQLVDILNATRKTIIERLKKDGSAEGGKDGMDASLTVYDIKNHKLIIAAANNPVWIVRGTETIEIKPDKMPVGKHDRQDVSFTQHEIELKTGDVIYTLTDGFPDQFGGERGKKFMSKNLRELLSANAHLPLVEQKELLETTFKNWVGTLEQVDDVTLIGVRV